MSDEAKGLFFRVITWTQPVCGKGLDGRRDGAAGRGWLGGEEKGR